MSESFIEFIRTLYPNQAHVPLHEPHLCDDDKRALAEAIDSTFVSSAGPMVERFETKMCEITGANYAVAMVNGTSALHMALLVAGVKPNDLVLTQALTFVATCNAISYCAASPAFIDIERESLSLSPKRLEAWLIANTTLKDGLCYEKTSQRIVRACVPVHILGHPAKSREIKAICERFNITMVEDAAEALGSYSDDGQHIGKDGLCSVFSFNGNKIVTCGGGGVMVTNDEAVAIRAKHLSSTAKCNDSLGYDHDQIGYNYRLPNINAALGCAQLDKLAMLLDAKRHIANRYEAYCAEHGLSFLKERAGTRANYWLNAVILESEQVRDEMLNALNENQIFARPVWRLMTDLPMYNNALCDELTQSRQLAQTAICLPSGVPYLQ
jgi:perosamine synthetase